MAYLAVAFDRTNTEPFNVEKMSFDIITEFPELSDEDLKKAIKNGGLGKYGKTYKLSTQEVCIWIREYIKENEIKIGKIWERILPNSSHCSPGGRTMSGSPRKSIPA